MKNITLDKTWKLKVADLETAPYQTLDFPAEIPIPVPGDIPSALLDSGLIADPYYGRNELDCLWIGKTDWHLSTIFDLDSEDYR